MSVNNISFFRGGIAGKHRTLNLEDPGSNPVAVNLKLWQFNSPHIATLNSIYIDRGGYLKE